MERIRICSLDRVLVGEYVWHVEVNGYATVLSWCATEHRECASCIHHVSVVGCMELVRLNYSTVSRGTRCRHFGETSLTTRQGGATHRQQQRAAGQQLRVGTRFNSTDSTPICPDLSRKSTRLSSDFSIFHWFWLGWLQSRPDIWWRHRTFRVGADSLWRSQLPRLPTTRTHSKH